jgi:phosphoglycerol transferase MdoB-like AlkP superfamily enzyme
MKSRFSILFGLSFFFLLASGLIRIILWIWEWDSLNNNLLQFLPSFITGWAYDVGVLSVFWVILGSYLLLFPKKYIGNGLDKSIIYFTSYLTIFILVFTFFAEVTFWDEFHARFNFVAVDYLIYTYEVVRNINESYPLVLLIPGMLLISLVVIASLHYFRFYKNSFQNQMPISHRLRYYSISVGIFFIFLFGIQNRDAEWSDNRYVNEINKAGIYSFFAAFRSNELEFKTFYATISESEALKKVKQDLLEKNSVWLSENDISRKIKNSTDNDKKTPNVIFVLMESMSANYLETFGNQQHLTPFLDSLANQGMLFKNLYATGTRTVRGMEAIALSIPPTPGSSIVKRPNNQNLHTISEVFKVKGYQCQFFYGGDGYFDNMNAFFGGNGFDLFDRGRGSVLSDHIHTKRTLITDKEVQFENAWGICDEDIYQKVIQVSNQMHQKNKPFFHFVMTTSNHKPYTYPSQKVIIPSGTSREGAVQYADYALKQLFNEAKKQAWFDQTIFILVADHCASSAGKDEIDIKNYRVPGIIFGKNIAKQNVEQLCSQIDIFPTLFAQLQWDYTSHFFGKNVFDPHYQPRAFVGTYLLLGELFNDNKLVILNNKKECKTYKRNPITDELKFCEHDTAKENLTKAYYQIADQFYHQQIEKNRKKS